MNEKLQAKLATLPLKPGCYLMKDQSGTIIYVGKAKKLKNRVNQYFVGAHDYKTTKMVSKVVDFDYVVTTSEKEALLLEINLIKEHRPEFNIMFMDDASYPYLRLTKEKYPTLRVVRDLKKHANARYFGPYPDAYAARKTYELLQELFPLRKCKVMPKKVCLYYHLGQCLGPCEYPIDPLAYQKMYEGLVNFLNGDTKEVKKMLVEKRDLASEQLKYEQAKRYQDMLASLDYVTDKQHIDIDSKENVDTFAFYEDKGYISLQGLFMRNGQLLDRMFQLRPLYELPQEALESFVLQYYDNHPLPNLILLPEGYDYEALNENLQRKIKQPQKGKYQKLVSLAQENAKQKLQQEFTAVSDHLLKEEKALAELRSLLNSHPVNVIEMFDNSHISGSNAVAGMIVYREGIADKNSYRRFKVHEGGDDLGNMKEVIYRRYFRLLREHKPLPDVLLVDGGQLQVGAAKEVLNALNITSIALLGAKKDEHHRTAALVNDRDEELPIKADSELFFLITRMQDEVHRFAIEYHRSLRLKQQVHSELDDISGIGPVKKKKLLKGLGSFANIQNASIQQLEGYIDHKSAAMVYDYFHPHD